MISTISDEYIVSNEFPNILQAIEKFLKPQDRGFELVYAGLVPNRRPAILYQSSQCKMRIHCRRDRDYSSIELSISYGRLHAPRDEDTMEWNGKKCLCWHRLTLSPLLFFLDGLSPAKAVELKFGRTKVEADFLASSRKEWSVPEHWARRHAMLWEHYDQRLFNLFDLNRPDLWEEYATFLKEYYEMDTKTNKSSRSVFNGVDHPFLYQVC
jgi:hypothetical protein